MTLMDGKKQKMCKDFFRAIVQTNQSKNNNNKSKPPVLGGHDYERRCGWRGCDSHGEASL